jgi:S1-C subfamily serine protease
VGRLADPEGVLKGQHIMNMLNFALSGVGADTARLLDGVRRSVVVVHSHGGHGAGVVWGDGGLIVTNDHVAPRTGRAVVDVADGRRLDAAVVARDRENDLALLQVRAWDLTAAPVGDSAALRVGEIVLAVGHPHGVRDTATLGIVSAAGRGTWMGRARREVLQADIVLAPGNSGGPLVNTRGEVVGIAAMILAPGIAVAVPSHVVARFVRAATRGTLRMAA